MEQTPALPPLCIAPLSDYHLVNLNKMQKTKSLSIHSTSNWIPIKRSFIVVILHSINFKVLLSQPDGEGQT